MRRTNEDEIISKIATGNNYKDRVIPIRVDLVDICDGDLNAGIMLAQLIYWSDRGAPKNDGWIYKSATDWFDETRLSDHKVKSATKKLKELGFITTQNRVARGHNTRYYLLNVSNVMAALDELYSQRRRKESPVDISTDTLDKRATALDNMSNYTESTIKELKENTLNKKSFKKSIIDSSNDANDFITLDSQEIRAVSAAVKQRPKSPDKLSTDLDDIDKRERIKNEKPIKSTFLRALEPEPFKLKLKSESEKPNPEIAAEIQRMMDEALVTFDSKNDRFRLPKTKNSENNLPTDN